MQWSDITTPPPQKLLRQFAGLCLVVFGGLAVWRVAHIGLDGWAGLWAALGVGIGSVGLIRPSAVRFIYTGWMIAAFPIGWTISRLMLALMFYLVFTPVALVFRLMRRDALHLRRSSGASYWRAKPGAAQSDEYFRQF